MERGGIALKIVRVEIIPYRIAAREHLHEASQSLSALSNAVVVIHIDNELYGLDEAVSESKWNSTVLEAHTELVRSYLAPAILGLYSGLKELAVKISLYSYDNPVSRIDSGIEIRGTPTEVPRHGEGSPQGSHPSRGLVPWTLGGSC